MRHVTIRLYALGWTQWNPTTPRRITRLLSMFKLTNIKCLDVSRGVDIEPAMKKIVGSPKLVNLFVLSDVFLDVFLGL